MCLEIALIYIRNDVTPRDMGFTKEFTFRFW
jgi:hypothetical protein